MYPQKQAAMPFSQTQLRQSHQRRCMVTPAVHHTSSTATERKNKILFVHGMELFGALVLHYNI